MNQVDYQQEKGQQVQDSQGCGEEETKRKGLEFMGLRYNIQEQMRYLRNKKIITPSEKAVLEEIICGTAGAQNGKSTIATKTDLSIGVLSYLCGYKVMNKIWPLLKSLHEKYLITREPSKFKDCELIGLNPYFWGQVLIDSQHQLEVKRHLKMVVDNSKPLVDNAQEQHTNHVLPTHEPCVIDTRTVCAELTNCVLDPQKSVEIIDELALLDSSRSILDCIRGEKPNQSEERFTPLTIGIEELQKKNNQSRVKPRNDSEDDPRDSEDAIKARDQAMKLFRKMGLS